MMRWELSRLCGVMLKEFIQMKRDKATFAMIVGIPLLQLILFGFAINLNPKHLPAAIVGDVYSQEARTILSELQASTYFDFLPSPVSEVEANKLIKNGEVQFVLRFPPNFSRDLIRGLRPQLLLQADATDPSATSRAASLFNALSFSAFSRELNGSLSYLQSPKQVYEPVVHDVYNPLAITAYNIVPGLLGVVLTMTMVVITSLAITREYERGTMENLLATPLRPFEVMLGKILPYIMVGYIQVLLILLMAKVLFGVPMQGSILLLLLLCLPFIAANLALGLTFSTLASNQLQAVQSSLFFFLPSILLTGFMFPFRGMPVWAQYIGELLPLRHFLIIVREILLKGNGFVDVWQNVIPILIFFVVVMLVSYKRYRETLD